MTDQRTSAATTAPLLPCPFCGDADVELGRSLSNWPAVGCNYCGTVGPCTDLHSDEAVKAWNTRSDAPAQPTLDRDKVWHTIAKEIACEEDCQKWPNGCGCAQKAADAVLVLAAQPPAAPVETKPFSAKENLREVVAQVRADIEAAQSCSAGTEDEAIEDKKTVPAEQYEDLERLHYNDLLRCQAAEREIERLTKLLVIANEPQSLSMPRVVDDDNGEITVELDDRELRGWSYSDDAERRAKMLAAREYVEGWCDGRKA